MNVYQCKTIFDITNTGVTGHFKPSRVPFTDRAGHRITDDAAWDRSRNQQRNWETLTQLLSLRTQVFDLSRPVREGHLWVFKFSSETPDVYGNYLDPVAILKLDADGVPMLINLDDDKIVSRTLIVSGKDQNIWFSQIG